jgi:predicted GTPase
MAASHWATALAGSSGIGFAVGVVVGAGAGLPDPDAAGGADDPAPAPAGAGVDTFGETDGDVAARGLVGFDAQPLAATRTAAIGAAMRIGCLTVDKAYRERVVIGGEGGSVLVAAYRASQPPVALLVEGLATHATTPQGVRAFPAEAPGEVDCDVVELIAGERATRDAVRAWASARGVAVREIALDELTPPEGVRVVTVSAATTGSGKTALTRRIARGLKRSGVDVAVARHPIPSLLHGGRTGVRVFRSTQELVGPIDEREELEPVVGAGVPVASGLDPDEVLAAAAAEARTVVWDGGGSASPWVRPDIRCVVVDLVRGFPSGAEEQIAAADAIVLAKADSANPERTHETEAAVREINPDADLVLMDMPVTAQPGQKLMDKAVVVVEDAPSLLYGGLKAGAGAVAARRFRCGVIDPRPFAVGAIAEALERYPHIGPVIPSLGRTPGELADLIASVRATPGQAVLWASPASPERVLRNEPRPVIRAYGEMMEVAGPPLQYVVRSLLPGQGTP